MGYLKLRLAPHDDGTGELLADFESNGFAGHGSAWFDLVDLAKTAMQFEQYPLPNAPPVCLAGGYWNSDKPATLKVERKRPTPPSTHPRAHRPDSPVLNFWRAAWVNLMRPSASCGHCGSTAGAPAARASARIVGKRATVFFVSTIGGNAKRMNPKRTNPTTPPYR